jgi:predicted phosphodiesterase
MKQKYAIVLYLFLFSYTLQAQEVLHTVFLIGDAGKDTIPGPTLLLLQKELKNNPSGSVIVLGDNIYPQGFDRDKLSEKRLLSQLNVMRDYKGNIFFVPGNHDWKAGKWEGMKCLKREENFVDDFVKTQAKTIGGLFPKDGLPGPYTTLIAANLRLVCVDTHWWLHSQFFHRVGKLKGKNKRQTSKIFFHKLDSILEQSKNKGEEVLLVAHHPLISGGVHSLQLEPLRFLINYTPLQVLGLLGANRLFTQGMRQPRYNRMKKKMLNSISKYDHVIYACGHEHNIQYYKREKHLFIISGSGSKLSKMQKKREGLIYSNDTQNGFIKMEFLKNKSVRISVLYPDTPEKIIDDVAQ